MQSEEDLLLGKRYKRCKYDKVQSQQRRHLLHLVDKRQKSIKQAANQLGINYSTCKTILQLFRKTGRIDRLERLYILQKDVGNANFSSAASQDQELSIYQELSQHAQDDRSIQDQDFLISSPQSSPKQSSGLAYKKLESSNEGQRLFQGPLQSPQKFSWEGIQLKQEVELGIRIKENIEQLKELRRLQLTPLGVSPWRSDQEWKHSAAFFDFEPYSIAIEDRMGVLREET